MLRKVTREYRKEVLGLGIDERLALASSLYKSNQKGSGIFATAIVNFGISEFEKKHFKWLDKFIDDIKNWGATDDFCLNIIQPLLLKYPQDILKILRKWNKSKNTWARRASVVAFVRTIGESGKFTDECIELCDNLLEDPERLVKQGVGWALKDSLRGNKKKIFNYIKKLRKQKTSAIITLYAIRDLKGREREEILKNK